MLTVHRGAHEIGSSCIEVTAPDGARLILDAGRPLGAPQDVRGLLPATLDLARPATVLFSHPHLDHWGLIEELPSMWPVWSGEKAAVLIRLTSGLFAGSMSRPIHTWHSRVGTFALDGFVITPFLTDHSAPDAYMLLIEAAGRRILYTGSAHLRFARPGNRVEHDRVLAQEGGCRGAG